MVPKDNSPDARRTILDKKPGTGTGYIRSDCIAQFETQIPISSLKYYFITHNLNNKYSFPALIADIF